MSLITQQLSLHDLSHCRVVCTVDRALDKLDNGQLLMISANQPSAIPDIRNHTLRDGNEILRFLDDEQAFTFVIRKRSTNPVDYIPG